MSRDEALHLALALSGTPWRPVPPEGRARSRFRAIGDPQASLEKFLGILDARGLLGPGGRLAPDVGLVSMGDHFDYEAPVEEAARSGLAILRWLAEHPPDQVAILAGNHDLSRVMELAFESDATWPLARELGSEHERLRTKAPRAPDEDARLEEVAARFAREFPRVGTPGLAGRDFFAFREEQRRLVEALLLGGRFRLGLVARGLGGDLLLTHAGVTSRDLELLGVARPGAVDATTVARALNATLEAAVERVRGAWERGCRAALDLGELHRAGRNGLEGGGLLYHRPINPEAPKHRGRREPARGPRRYDASELPPRLHQLTGHTGHKKNLEDLEGWYSDEARARDRGGLRTLRSSGERFVYELGLTPVAATERAVYMVDAEMHQVTADAYPLAELEGF